MVHGFDPLQSEPKPKITKKSKYKYPCFQCEHAYSYKSEKKHVKFNTMEWDIHVLIVSMPQLQQVV